MQLEPSGHTHVPRPWQWSRQSCPWQDCEQRAPQRLLEEPPCTAPEPSRTPSQLSLQAWATVNRGCGADWAHRGLGQQAPLKCQGSPESRIAGARRSAPRWPRSLLPGSGGGVWGGVGTAWVWAGAVSTREPHAGLRSHPVTPAQVHVSRLAQRVGGR